MVNDKVVLGWGIIGCGLISGDVCESIKLLPSTQHRIVAVGASSIDRAKSFIDTHQLDGTMHFDSYEQVMQTDGVDIVYIGLRNHQHKDAVISALNHGKHVLCEKPLGLNANQVQQMIDCARANKRFLMEGFWSRFFPVYHQIRHELTTRSIGNVAIVQCDMGSAKNPNDEKMVRLYNRDQGGGLALDIGCYAIQFALFAFGHEYPEQISVIGWQRDGYEVDDTACVTLKFSGNRIAQLMYTGSASCACQAIICGDKGRLEIPNRFWCPDKLIKTITSIDQSPPITYSHPLPKPPNDQLICYANSSGLSYELAAVRETIINGELENSIMPLNESLTIARILDEIRRQLNVHYSVDT